MTTPAAPDAYLSVICQPSDTATFETFRARAAAAGMSEYRTVPMVYHEWSGPAPVEIVEWWTQLAAGAVVYPARDNVPVLHVTGLLWRRVMVTTGGARTRWDVYSVDIPGRRVCIYPDGRGIVGGLWVSPDDIIRE